MQKKLTYKISVPFVKGTVIFSVRYLHSSLFLQAEVKASVSKLFPLKKLSKEVDLVLSSERSFSFSDIQFDRFTYIENDKTKKREKKWNEDSGCDVLFYLFLLGLGKKESLPAEVFLGKKKHQVRIDGIDDRSFELLIDGKIKMQVSLDLSNRCVAEVKYSLKPLGSVGVKLKSMGTPKIPDLLNCRL